MTTEHCNIASDEKIIAVTRRSFKRIIYMTGR